MEGCELNLDDKCIVYDHLLYDCWAYWPSGHARNGHHHMNHRVSSPKVPPHWPSICSVGVRSTRWSVTCVNTDSNKSWSILAQGMFQLHEINQMECEMYHWPSSWVPPLHQWPWAPSHQQSSCARSIRWNMICVTNHHLNCCCTSGHTCIHMLIPLSAHRSYSYFCTTPFQPPLKWLYT